MHSGSLIGTVGGGAGEGKIIEQALKVFKSKEQLVEIDLTGMPGRETQGVCDGKVRVIGMSAVKNVSGWFARRYSSKYRWRVGLRQLTQKLHANIKKVEFAVPEVLVDINDEEAYQRSFSSMSKPC
ncbi:XdhC family protein [Leptolyngbya sp. BC1307]|uniref:XdhC family protein n=1 Tax=Leptolyngbya sp. BC1307 TaxID=2029589 RepID=UPI000EFCB92E|nr:XdhC family protein [Leptolyngbya sp. BC1307]